MAWNELHPRDEVAAAIEVAMCWSDALRALGLPTRGHDIRTRQRWARRTEQARRAAGLDSRSGQPGVGSGP